MNAKYALYIRTSTDNQEESIKLQTKELITYCESRNYEIFEKYIDFGFSGSNIDRPAFQHLMNDAKKKKFDVVLVTKIDRFARSIIDCLVSIQKLQDLNIQFSATSQPIDTSSAMGKLTLNIMAAFADFERTMIRERMEYGRLEAEKRGVICHRPRKELSRRKVEEYLKIGMSANSIAKLMNVNVATVTARLSEWGYVYKNGEWVINES